MKKTTLQSWQCTFQESNVKRGNGLGYKYNNWAAGMSSFISSRAHTLTTYTLVWYTHNDYKGTKLAIESPYYSTY